MIETALPLIAGALLVVARGGRIGPVEVLVLLAAGLALTALQHYAKTRLPLAMLVAVAAMFVGFAVGGGAAQLLAYPLLWAVAFAYAAYAANIALALHPPTNAPMALRLLNTLALLAVAVPVVVGALHWAIVILPFAVFRIAMTRADTIAQGSLEERAPVIELARKIYWISGGWIAGWVGVSPPS